MNTLRSRSMASMAGFGLVLALTGCSDAASRSDDTAVTGTVRDAAASADKQLAYALAHWNDYNTAEYGDLNPVGGDCANFVSQTLIARGWQMNSQWYNHGAAAGWSPAWGYVPAMDGYLRSAASKLGITEYSFDQRDKVKVGDIVMFDWDDDDSLDHVQIVSSVQEVDGTIVIKMAGHNIDTDYRDLDETITVDHPGAVGHFWGLSK